MGCDKCENYEPPETMQPASPESQGGLSCEGPAQGEAEGVSLEVCLAAMVKQRDQLLGKMMQLQARLAAKDEEIERLRGVNAYECGLHAKWQEKAEAAEARASELQEHERQTHERLGAILGTDTSLEDGAKRLLARASAAEKKLADHLSAHRTADAHDCAEMEEMYQYEKARASAAEAERDALLNEQKPLFGEARSRVLKRLGVPNIDAALVKIDSTESRLAAAEEALRLANEHNAELERANHEVSESWTAERKSLIAAEEALRAAVYCIEAALT